MYTDVGYRLNMPKEGFLGVYCERTIKTLYLGLANSRYNELFSCSLQSSLYRDSTVYLTTGFELCCNIMRPRYHTSCD